MNIEFISNEFVQKVVANNPKPLSELGEFVYYRTYSRWLEHRGRRENWQETVKRAIEFNMALAYKHTRDIGYKVNLKEMKKEAERLFKNVYETKQFLSGRTFWVGNANPKINKEFVLGNFNCSFINIVNWDDLGDLFYLLLVGTGVGFKSTKKMAAKMPKIRTNVKLLHSDYKPVAVEQRLEHTKLTRFENGFAKIYVGDSKEGWVESLREFLKILTDKEYEDVHTIKISYNSVRPKGERLKTFGGTASGHEPLREMFEGFDNVLKNKIDSHLAPIETDEKGYGHIRPIHILDMGNLVGANVVIGGVRRTAEIFLFDADDYECMLAKYGINGIWTEQQLAHHKVLEKC
jgi:ribonucleoside-triphosphate reductase